MQALALAWESSGTPSDLNGAGNRGMPPATTLARRIHDDGGIIKRVINPYESPGLPATRSRALFVLGVILLVVGVAMPILGLAGTVAGMMYSFNELAEPEMPSPGSFADGISFSLSTTVLGLIVGILAAILGAILIFIGRRGGQAAK